VIIALPKLQDKAPPRGFRTFRDGEELAPLLQAADHAPRSITPRGAYAL
jgi:hypothetical protein